ncbi:MAG: fumarate hydratase [Candidatus Abyssobacteria bacterium SURF_5]|uniref:Fumarate hydratase n=1 Tax=Abyssobacteria bacterium (strain SURF_5) TaxID=2093360 RepID=A0A3A4NTM0_ABYX5|nr:MAG: fumarate hydratase [Candidatus Abyssubacteria bacterium SURF_5]
MQLIDQIRDLYRRMATEMSDDVYQALKRAQSLEQKDSPGYAALSTILENIDLAKSESKPICQDTGYPVFFVTMPENASISKIRDAITEATKLATAEIPLRPNAVDSVSGRNSGDNTGILWPMVHFDSWERDSILIEGMLKGGGSENCGTLYKLPDSRLRAGRDLDGVRKVVLDAVHSAQGRACPPYVIGVGIGGSKDATSLLSKRQLLRKLDDSSPVPELAALESRLMKESNSLGIGPIGVGGETCVMGVKVAAAHRHAASYFVDVVFCCWADRKGRLEYHGTIS